VSGRVEGTMRLGPTLRTLDDLNIGREFLALRTPSVVPASFSAGSGRFEINKSAVVLVTENVKDESERPPARPQGYYSRVPLHLLVGDYDVHGMFHVPPGGDAITRLVQERHTFIALTTASVEGPGVSFTTPFLAVNRSFVRMVQELVAEMVQTEAPDIEATT
jgi:hypothetical protein